MSFEQETADRSLSHLVRMRFGQGIGLLFLIGPFSDLARRQMSPAREAVIWTAAALFVALYLALLPPIRSLARRRRRWTLAALGLLVADAAAALLLGAPRSFGAFFVYVVAAAGMLLAPRAAVVVIALVATGVGVGLAKSGAGTSSVASFTLTIVAIGAMMVAFGRKAQANRELEAARDELARYAVTEERLRIARDLHDLLGHTLSVIALKSELAAKLVEREPERARAELADVQQVTRQALGEVREAVQGYRRLALADAVDGARAALAAAGIACRVDAVVSGLPGDVENVVAWAVREATTNVVRHSDASACAIRLREADGRVELDVDDDGRAAAPAGEGTGLTGLAERAERLRGTLEAGARPEGGFRLRLTVPLPAS